MSNVRERPRRGDIDLLSWRPDWKLVLKRPDLSGKRVSDVLMCLALLPVLAVTTVVVWALNFRLNPGPVFYVQKRMGKDANPIHIIKLRSMLPVTEANGETRAGGEPLELDRITKLGAVLRKSRLDELPQILSVLRGDMSLIGPRPDAWDHAQYYCDSIPGYVERHAVTPGISGLAQVEVGYVEGLDAVRRKVAADLRYIENASFGMDLWIVWRTVCTVVLCRGT